MGSKFYSFWSSATISYYFPERSSLLENENIFPFITKAVSLWLFWAIVHISVHGNLNSNSLTSCFREKLGEI